MRIQTLTFIVAFCLLATYTQAQDSLYFFYDASCMQKFDYQRVDQIREEPTTDYYMSVSNIKKLIFKVRKDEKNLNKTIVNGVKGMPFMCGDQWKITDNIVESINNATSVAFIMVEAGTQYALYKIDEVAALTETQQGIRYEDSKYGFVYNFKNSNTIQSLNRSNNKERNIYFESTGKMGCYAKYTFKIVSRHQEDPIMRLNLVGGLGVHRIYTGAGEMRLVSINDMQTHNFIKAKCNGVAVAEPTPTVAQPDPEPTKPQIIQDTVGMSLTEKALWLSKRSSSTGTRLTSNPYADPAPNPPAEPNPTNPVGPTTVPMDTLPGGYYIVKYQENLYTISDKFNISVKRLAEINNLQGFALGLNQRLKVVDDGSVPVASSNPIVEIDNVNKTKTTIHLVEKGETLYSIGKRYGLGLPEVCRMNKQITDQNVIDINQRIVVGVEQLVGAVTGQ